MEKWTTLQNKEPNFRRADFRSPLDEYGDDDIIATIWIFPESLNIQLFKFTIVLFSRIINENHCTNASESFK